MATSDSDLTRPAADDQARVFISYARRDQAAVRRWCDALAEHGRTLWVDWEGIPPSAEWMTEIEDGIRSADAFVFMLSPASLASTVCRQEMDIAIALAKRLVPVMIEDVPAADVPPELARLNWIFLREHDDADQGLAALTRALDTDLDWLKRHTALMGPALAWQDAGRERSRLLKGRALKQAEAWLADSAAKSPPPADVQLAFIQASGQAARTRLRLALGGAIAGAASLAVLALWAMFAERRADVAREEAVARRLGADAALIVREQAAQIETSALLAIEAAKRRPALSNDVPLRAALRLLPAPIAQWSHPAARIEAARLLDHGRRLAYGAANELRIVELDSRTESARHDLEAPIDDIRRCGDADAMIVRTRTRAGAVRVHFWPHVGRPGLPLPGATIARCDPDGRRLAMGESTGRIRLIARDESAPLQELPAPLGKAITAMRFSHDGRLLAASSNERLQVWDLTEPKLMMTETMRQPIVDLDFSPDGERLMAAADSGAYLWRVSDGQRLKRLGQLTNVFRARFSPDGVFIALAVGDGGVVLYDARRLERVRQMTHQSPVHHLRFSADSRLLLSAANDNTARLWRIDDGSEQLRFAHDSFVTAIDWPAGGGVILTAGRDGRVKLWRDALFQRQVLDGPLRMAAISAHGDRRRISRDAAHLLEPLGEGRWVLRAYGAADPLLRFDSPSSIAGFALSPDRSVLALVRFDQVIDLRQLPDGASLGQLAPGAPTDTLGFSPDGSLLLTGSRDAQVRLWSWRDGALRWQQRHAPFVFSHAFSADGRRVATGGSDQTVRIWAVADGRAERTLNLPSYPDADNDAKALAFHPDGHVLATGSSDHQVRLWDTDTGQVLRTLLHRDPVLSVAFSADGAHLASSASDDTVRIWRTADGSELSRIEAPLSASAIGFAGEQLRIFTGGEWAAHFVARADLVAATCAHLTHNLGPDDWARHMDGGRPAPTCPDLPMPTR
jgi:WD40 repeat protein